MRKVVLTGAAGYVAGRMLSALRQRYDLTLLDVRTADRGGEEVEGIVATDLVNPDRDAYREHFRGADAVVHCGLAKPSRPEDRSWASETRYRSEIDNINTSPIMTGPPNGVMASSGKVKVRPIRNRTALMAAADAAAIILFRPIVATAGFGSSCFATIDIACLLSPDYFH